MLFMLRYAVTLCWNCLEYCEYRISFVIYGEQEIRPWTHMMDVPQLHGLGPAANRLLESYSQLLKASPPAPCPWEAQNKLSIVKYSFGVVGWLSTVAAKLAENARFVLRGGSRIGCSCWCGIGGVVVGEIGSWVWGSIATSQQWAQHTFIIPGSWLPLTN